MRLYRLNTELRRFARNWTSRAALVVAICIPLLYGALYLWAFWNPTGHLDRLPVAMLLATVTLIAAQPLGLKLQGRVTTSPDPGALKLKSVRQVQQGKLISHWVSTGE